MSHINESSKTGRCSVVSITCVWSVHFVPVSCDGWMTGFRFKFPCLCRQIEKTDPNEPNPPPEEPSEEPLSPHIGSTTGLFPTFTAKTLKPNTRLLKNGLTKRSISVKGSDGVKYRVVSYYHAADVLAMKLKSRSSNGAIEPRSSGNAAGAADFRRPYTDVGLKEAVIASGVDVESLCRQSNPQWKGIQAEPANLNRFKSDPMHKRGLHSLLIPSPFEPSLDCFALDADFAQAMTPFMGSFADPAFTGPGPSLLDDFSFDGLEDFSLFGDDSISASTNSLNTPLNMNLSTPLLPIGGTPFIPLQATPYMPSLPLFPEQQKVTISMEDLAALLQLANKNRVDLGQHNLDVLQQQISALTASTMAMAAPSQPQITAPPAVDPSSSSAAAPAPDTRPEAGGKIRRRTSAMHTCPHPNCGKQFSRLFNLKTHEQTHEVNRARDFVCTEVGCGKTFVRVHDLARHAIAHDQTRWHFCVGCSRGFARIDALKRHEKGGCRARGGSESSGSA
ncbi:hypothetical protein HDU98_008405 [Podochytrium sp. JEL0797]|nr:hypothetical protein HDU98_008405 [Podochytrium sp. JEL0797]